MSAKHAERVGGDAGAILVEFALLAPLMALLAMGLLEFGLTLRESQRGAATVQVTARAAANTPGNGNAPASFQGTLADFNAISAIASGMPHPELINRVVIFDADATGDVPAACTTFAIPSGTGGTADCNIYSGAWIDSTFNPASPALFTSGTANCGTGVDATFCPEGRRVASTGAGQDWVGVYMEYRRDTTTGMFGSSFTMSETAVYRNEPQAEVEDHGISHDTHSKERAADAGYVLALFALLLLPLMIVVGFAVDLGFWYTQATREQRAADAAALAGVVWLPDVAKATSVALDTAERNGYDNADPDIVVTVTPDIDSARLQVRIDDGASLFFSSVVLGDFDIARQAVAEYTKPVPMGSPRNYLGTSTLLAAPARENLNLAIGGYCIPREWGDGIIGPSAAEDSTGTGTDFQSCIPGNPSTVHANPDHAPEGYIYAVEIPVGSTGSRNVDVYDAAACSSTGGMVDSAGDSGAVRPSFTYTMRSNDSPNPLEATVLSTTVVTPAQCTSIPSSDNNWRTIHTLSNPTPGIYYLQIQPVVPADRTLNQGWNHFSLRAIDPSWGANWACTFDSAFALSNAPHRADCPKVYAVNNLGVQAVGAAGQPEFFLASIGPEHATKTAHVELYDTAEGAQAIEILDPNGNPTPFTWEIACGDGSYRSENSGSCATATGENAPNGGYGPTTGVSIINVSGTVASTQRTWDCRNAQDGKYNDRTIRLTFALPSLATQPTWFSGRTWYKVRYTTGANLDDHTTWSIYLIGDPVHLVE